MSDAPLSTDECPIPERAWVVEVRSRSGWWLPAGATPTHTAALELMDNLSKSDPTCTFKVEQYMRVLSRQEVEKLAGEGVDVQQYINSLLRQIEGQKRHIARLEATCQRYAEAMEDEGHV